MKNIIIFCLVTIVLASCGPSQEQIQQAIQQTEVAASEATAKVPTPTMATIPTNTIPPEPTPTDVNDKARQQMTDAIKKTLKQLAEVDEVQAVNFGDGAIEVEFISTSAEKMEQPDLAYGVAVALGYGLSGFNKLELETLGKGDPFVLRVISVSTDNRYRYVTESDYKTFLLLGKALDGLDGLSSDEWQELANGTFE